MAADASGLVCPTYRPAKSRPLPARRFSAYILLIFEALRGMQSIEGWLANPGSRHASRTASMSRPFVTGRITQSFLSSGPNLVGDGRQPGVHANHDAGSLP